MREQLGELARDAARAGRYLTQSLRLMVGVPDYGSYLAHHQATHPEREPMSYEEFFMERQAARYSARVGKCC
ncbi:YbdD/YjiX family protein [Roseateles sp.]|uniref:YbdD/YjiX family protein n=1 Tax=Roseateles sp. TaxID=1971397 RepID=UPI0025E773FF|nr:YbdD/YjiX family protein [Roseateles sp.]MBV8034925.1 YbdD/YjiX family protein [Roseateles sp.]